MKKSADSAGDTSTTVTRKSTKEKGSEQQNILTDKQVKRNGPMRKNGFKRTARAKVPVYETANADEDKELMETLADFEEETG